MCRGTYSSGSEYYRECKQKKNKVKGKRNQRKERRMAKRSWVNS
jgi:hypothetical protein